MILLIAGGTHTGKTVLAQKFLEKYHYPYLSIDHLKMGLIRSGYCRLTPESGKAELTAYLWPVVREMIKTAIENKQNLIVEGCYIPVNYKKDFQLDYLRHIRYLCLVLSGNYIRNHYSDIRKQACDIEFRAYGDSPSMESLLAENQANLKLCQKYGAEYILIDNKYEIAWEL